MPHEILSYKYKTLSAISFIVTGFFAYSISDLCSKILQERHYPSYQILAISALIGLVITGIWLFQSGGIKAFFPQDLKLHLVRAVLISVSSFCSVSALKTLPMADFYGIVFITPFIVLILAVIFLKEQVGWRRWSAVAVAFTGVLILAGPQFDTLGVGILYAGLGALMGSLNVIALRFTKPVTSLPLYGFYPFLVMSIITVSLLFSTTGFQPIPVQDMGFFALQGPVIILGIICCSIGFSRSPQTSMVAPFHYTQIIWGALFGYIFFQAVPKDTTWAGLVLVVGAGLFSIYREYKLAHDKKTPPDSGVVTHSHEVSPPQL